MGRRLWATVVVLAASGALGPRDAGAHGLWGHVHVTGWAVENLPEGELRDFFDEPEVRAALLAGASFPDSGYAPRGDGLEAAAREYGEHAHWEPFVQDFIAWILENEPPPFDTLEQRRHVAFLMGCAAHGLQDEIFDSLFLYQVEQHDGAGQAEADPATDGFLALDGHLRLVPEKYLPFEILIPLFAELDHEITEALIEGSVNVVFAGYLNDTLGMRVAESIGRDYDDQLPWTREHYLDIAIPGSLLTEVYPTAAYLQTIWDRLHGRFDESELVTYRFPDPPRRLLGAASSSPDSWVTLVFGIGLQNGTATTRFLDADEEAVPYVRRDTRFTNVGWSRLIRYQPSVDLISGATYTVVLDPGAPLIDGTSVALTHDHTFQVACDPPDEDLCPHLGELPVPVIEPPEPPLEEEPEPAPDAGADVASDAGDPGPGDGGAGDVGDAEEPDGDGGPGDPVDDEAGGDEVGGGGGTEDDGCGCAVGGQGGGSALVFGLALLWGRKRRATRRSRA